MRDNFGPYNQKELDGLLKQLSDEEVQHEYRGALDRYRVFVNYYDRQRPTVESSALVILERDRRTLHEQLIQIAHAAGKAGREVFADLAGAERTLTSRGLPEFQTILRRDIDFNLDFDYDDPDDVGLFHGETIEGVNDVSIARKLRKDEIGIVFARRIVNRVPTLAQFSQAKKFGGYTRHTGPDVAMEARGERERVRRAARLSLTLGVPMLRASSFSHNYQESVVGVVVDETSIDRVANEIRKHREQYGIRESDLGREVIEADWQAYRKMVEGLGPSVLPVYEHLYRKLHDPSYQLTDRSFVAQVAAERRRELRRVQEEGVERNDVPKKRRS